MCFCTNLPRGFCVVFWGKLLESSFPPYPLSRTFIRVCVKKLERISPCGAMRHPKNACIFRAVRIYGRGDKLVCPADRISRAECMEKYGRRASLTIEIRIVCLYNRDSIGMQRRTKVLIDLFQKVAGVQGTGSPAGKPKFLDKRGKVW